MHPGSLRPLNEFEFAAKPEEDPQGQGLYRKVLLPVRFGFALGNPFLFFPEMF